MDSVLMADTFCEFNSAPLSVNAEQEDRIEITDFGVLGEMGSSLLSLLPNWKHFMSLNKSRHRNFLTADPDSSEKQTQENKAI